MPGYKGRKAKRIPRSRQIARRIGTSYPIYKKVMPKVTNIKRRVNKLDLLISSSQAVTFSFALSDLSGYTDFTNLFDCYRINAVKVHIIPQANSNDTGATDTLSIPVIHYRNDIDDAVSVSNENQILEMENVKTRRLDRPFTHYFKVNTAGETYNNGITTAYSVNKRGVWIDGQYPNVAHFGFKAWIVTANVQTLRCKFYVTYYMQFKGAQ